MWIEDKNGRYAVLWPKGYYALFNPLRIFNGSGRELWRQGQLQDVGGGFNDYKIERVPAACRKGSLAWWMAPLPREYG